MCSRYSSRRAIGACVPLDASAMCASIDFVELTAAELLESPEHVVIPMARVVRRLLPGELRVVDHRRAVSEYMTRLLYRLSASRVRIAVLGSGRSRSIPEGHDLSVAMEALRRFLSDWRPAFNEQGILLALEPLSTSESNWGNSLDEVVRLLDLVDGVTLDVLHSGQDPSLATFAQEFPERILHVHVAGHHRRVPSDEDWKSIAAFLRTVFAGGATAGVSLEVEWASLRHSLDASVERIREIMETT